MKKIFAVLMLLCLLASMLCISAAAANAEEILEENYAIATGGETNPEGLLLTETFHSFRRSVFGSMFGEGSPAMIVALLALVISIVSICLTVTLYKKKANPADTNNNEENEDEE